MAGARAQFETSLALFRTSNDAWGIASVMNNLGEIARFKASLYKRRSCTGAAEALREATDFPLPQMDRAGYAADMAVLRSALDEASLTAAWEAGRQLAPEQATEFLRRISNEATRGVQLFAAERPETLT